MSASIRSMVMKTCALIITVTLASCSSEPDQGILLYLQTDLVPRGEFVVARTELFSAIPGSDENAPGTRVDLATTVQDDFGQPFRIAEYRDLAPGRHVVRVRLLGNLGERLLERIAIVEVNGLSVVTLIMTRNCAGFMCPGDNPTEIACLDGRCVVPECTVETDELCPAPMCSGDAECSTEDACAQPQCASGVCLSTPRPDACAAGLWCQPDAGCVELPIATDAGPRDSGVGLDAGNSGTPSCDDGQMNGSETGVDCGGTCMSCPVFPCAATAVRLEDCEAAVALYQGTNGPSWTNRAGWLETTDICSWYGVRCGAGRIRWLELAANGLDGSIPSNMGELSGCHRALLNDNALGGPLPADIQNVGGGVLNLRGQSRCLTADAGTASWLDGKTPGWNDGC